MDKYYLACHKLSTTNKLQNYIMIMLSHFLSCQKNQFLNFFKCKFNIYFSISKMKSIQFILVHKGLSLKSKMAAVIAVILNGDFCGTHVQYNSCRGKGGLKTNLKYLFFCYSLKFDNYFISCDCCVRLKNWTFIFQIITPRKLYHYLK